MFLYVCRNTVNYIINFLFVLIISVCGIVVLIKLVVQQELAVRSKWT